jgi:hypothetical protein
MGHTVLADCRHSPGSARGGNQLLLQVFHVIEEPDILAAIAFLDERLQSSALKSFFRNGADDGEFHAVVHEFLRNCAGKARTQLEEGGGEPDRWEGDQFCVPSNCFAEDVCGFAFSLNDGPSAGTSKTCTPWRV